MTTIPDPEPGKPIDHTLEYPASGTTQSQPFEKGTGTSANFRIPALITLDNGDLMAAIDARWNTTADSGGLDTIISISHDGGENWEYKYVNYFADSNNVFNTSATAFIDPELIQANDGTIYLLVDLWTGGTALSNAQQGPSANTDGYENIDGTERLVLYASPRGTSQTDSNYTHYVGSFADDGFAPVYSADNHNDPAYYVDHWYYIYDTDRQPVMGKQLGTNKEIQDNVFFWNDSADGTVQLHARATDYLWLVSSKDHGDTWSYPLILNPMVRQGEETGSAFYGVGPGRGLITDGGRILFTAYTWGNSLGGDGHTSVIYSEDGENWQRSPNVSQQSSEGAMVQVDDVLYLFSRHGRVNYWTPNAVSWTLANNLWPQKDTSMYTGCQIDAIRYSQKIDGQTAILISGPSGGGRSNGKIWVGLVDSDNHTINWKYEYSVNSGSYAYSGITETKEGNIALLYEGNGIQFTVIDIANIAPGAVIGNKVNMTSALYDTFTVNVEGLTSADQLTELNGVVSVTGTSGTRVTFRAMNEGSTSFEFEDVEYTFTVTMDGKNLVTIPLTVGETSAPQNVSAGTVDFVNGSSATNNVVTTEEAYQEPMIQLGTDSSYSGDVVPLTAAEFTVTGSADSCTLKNDATNVYLNVNGSGVSAQQPGSTSSANFTITDKGSNEFQIQQVGGTSGGGILFFWSSDTSKLHFDRNGSADGQGRTNFKLYTKYETGTPADIDVLAEARYYMVTSTDDIVNGQKYIIVKQANDNNYYMLYPSSTQSNQYAHVAKLLTNATYEVYTLTATGTSAGTTDVMVGDSIYRFVVTAAVSPNPPVVTPPVGGGETQIPDTDIPLNPTPDDGETDVDEGDTPLAPAPEDKGDTDIPDGDTPLDSTPKTGDDSIAIAILWSIFSLSAIGFVSVMLSMKKSGKHTK